MSIDNRLFIGQESKLSSYTFYSTLVLLLFQVSYSYQEDLLPLKAEAFVIDLHHKLGSGQPFTRRGSILVKPKSEYRVAQATFVEQAAKLTNPELEILRKASEAGDIYYLQASLRKKGAGPSEPPVKVTQTLVKACSLFVSNLIDSITINLSPTNEFVNVNLAANDPECAGSPPNQLSSEFNTTILVDSGAIGPAPDTATYIKRLEEERQSKLREGKEDNRSFFAKYWVYIVPAVIILMVFSGPSEQGR